VPAKKAMQKQPDQHPVHRFLRADARRNLDSLLTAAMAVFEISGVDAPMKEIAGEAGVGIATVYRHFPQRSDLIVAVLAQQIDACADTAKDFAAECAPDEALSRWMQCYIDLVAKKRGFAGALHSGNPAYAGLAPYFFERMEPALNALLSNALSAGVIQRGVSAGHLLTAVVRLCHGPQGEEPEYARMMVRLLLEGMACTTKEMKKSSANRKS
jgi:AcrR family transcriptional regulator